MLLVNTTGASRVNVSSEGVQPVAHKDGVAAVDRAIALLEAFDDGAGALSLSELAKRTGLVKSTVLRLAASLERTGCLQRRHDGAYRLGPTLFRLGAHYQASFHLGDHVVPVLDALSTATGESASFYVRVGTERVCLHRVHSMQHQLLHFVQVGRQFAYDTGASGAVIAAFTDTGGNDETRRRMVARSTRDRTILQSAAVAAPVFDASGAFVGAVSLAGPSVRFTDETVPLLERAVFDAAAAVTRSLGGPAAPYESARARNWEGREAGAG
jgi:DNA-binding IclR family transcriptional regulator